MSALYLIYGFIAASPGVGWIQDIFHGSLIVYTIHLIIHGIQSLYFRQVTPGVITSVIVFGPIISADHETWSKIRKIPHEVKNKLIIEIGDLYFIKSRCNITTNTFQEYSGK
jgi:hypothetical protein